MFDSSPAVLSPPDEATSDMDVAILRILRISSGKSRIHKLLRNIEDQLNRRDNSQKKVSAANVV